MNSVTKSLKNAELMEGESLAKPFTRGGKERQNHDRRYVIGRNISQKNNVQMLLFDLINLYLCATKVFCSRFKSSSRFVESICIRKSCMLSFQSINQFR